MKDYKRILIFFSYSSEEDKQRKIAFLEDNGFEMYIQDTLFTAIAPNRLRAMRRLDNLQKYCFELGFNFMAFIIGEPNYPTQRNFEIFRI